MENPVVFAMHYDDHKRQMARVNAMRRPQAR